MACGLPVILTDTGGARDLVDGNGFIVDTHSSESIKTVIKKYIDNRQLVEDHGRKSRAIAEKFSWQAMTDRYMVIYKKVLNKI